MRFLFFRRGQRAFGLLEVILVFALVLGAAGLVFTSFQSAQPSADASRANSSLTVLAANIKGAYASNGDYSAISALKLIQGNLVPKDLIAPSGTSLVGVWAAPILVQPTSDNQHFTIVYEGVTQVACTKFVLGSAPYFPTVSVGTTPTDPGVVVRTANGAISASLAASGCGASDPSVVSFTSN